MKSKFFVFTILLSMVIVLLLSSISCASKFDYEGSKSKMEKLGYSIIEMSPQIDNVASYYVADKEHTKTVHVIQFVFSKTAKDFFDISNDPIDYPNISIEGNVVYFGTPDGIADLIS
ncbi:MAG: hypothetical protein WCY33_02970 [Clostridia bacterium]